VRVRRNGDGAARAFGDYAVQVDDGGLPEGVTLHRMLD
jgi:hypothetical protein